MKNRFTLSMIIGILIILACLSLFSVSGDDKIETEISGYAKINPDYGGVTIPPNIAPLNFKINEEGEGFRVLLKSRYGELRRENRSGRMQFPIKAWKKLLNDNRGETLEIRISVKKNEQWFIYDSFYNQIAEHDIDSHLVYRLFYSVYTRWRDMGIYQRNIENFDEKAVIHNRATEQNCMNCHTFNKNDPETMMMHLRGGASSGTLILKDGQVRKVNTATDFNRAGAYAAWHPSGELIAYSVNNLEMFFHGLGREPRDVMDRGSDLILYYVDENIVTTSPFIVSVERMETFPTWSPDGSYLYYCSSAEFSTFVDGSQFDFEKIIYDLYRISYDHGTREWGAPELFLSGQNIGKSITLPRISPDGQYLLCCMAHDGHFPIYKLSTDLYIVNLQTRAYERLGVNSDAPDTYHTWSSNGRWFVFSSKRMDGLMAHPHFAYFDEDGRAHKPFVLPQKDPEFYKSFLKTYNRPELITGPIPVRSHKWIRTAYDNDNRYDAELDPKVSVRDEPVGSEKMYNVAPN